MSSDARALLKAKIQAMPVGMLLLAYDELDAKPNRDDAEKLLCAMLAGEAGIHIRAMVKEYSSESLISDLRTKYMVLAEDYKNMRGTERLAYWAITDTLEDRYPEAADKANEWLDSLTTEQKNDVNGWDNYFLALIEARAA